MHIPMTKQATQAKQQKMYEIKGFYFGEGKKVFNDSQFFTVGSDSMIDHQKMWYEEALKLGYESGELNEAGILRANYDGKLTEEQVISIINDGELMNTPFDELFPTKIKEYVLAELHAEFTDLEDYVNDNHDKKDCTNEKERMTEILNEIAQVMAIE